jgi:hypothetical protein
VTATSVFKSGTAACAHPPGPASATFKLTINPPSSSPDYSISPSASSLTVAPGSVGHEQITVTSFNGWNSDVALSASGFPSGVTGAFGTNPVPGGSGTSDLGITVPSGTAAGTSTITVSGTGVGNGVPHTATFTLTVGAGGGGGGGGGGGSGGSPTPKKTQVTVTVVYYMTQMTPGLGLVLTNSGFYILGSATLESFY